MSSTPRKIENIWRTIVRLRQELEAAEARITELQAAYAAEQAKATRLERAARGCAACDGDPEAHGLHVCGKEFGGVIADDLATLRGFFDPTLGHDDPFRQALARVEAEIARLNRESGMWSGADPRIVTLRRERDEALAEAARLRDGLRDVLHDLETGDPSAALSRVRALLAEDGAA